MNYLAHLSLSRPTVASRVGNLLGDFMRGVEVDTLPQAVRLGLANHRLVDRLTDTHAAVRDARALFSPARRRFAGVALDVLFDHFLWRHWSLFYSEPRDATIRLYYRQLVEGRELMPPAMAAAVTRLVEHDLLSAYARLAGVSQALDVMAGRIRFANRFAGIGEELDRHYAQLEALFLEFFPRLHRDVRREAIEWQPANRHC
ncbi:MAG: ACP phosphodiesterase [Alcanivorax sp.]|nr:ACP phosphodiesterase [Alcanivorax sp.]